MMRLVQIFVGSEGIIFLFRIVSAPFLHLSPPAFKVDSTLLNA